VCFIAGTLGQGGAERQLFYMLRALYENGARPRVLCLTRGEFWDGKIRALGIPVTWVGQHASRLGRLTEIVRALRGDKPAVLHSQHFYTNLYACAAGRTLNLRDVGSLRNDAVHESQETGAVLGRLSLRAPRVVVANSANAIRNAVAMGCPAERLRLLLNSVDTSTFEPVSGTRMGRVTVLAVGRLVPVKRFDRLLAVLARLKTQALPPWRAVIVGGGPLEQTLERQAADLGLLPDLVEFRGVASTMAPIYQEGDVLVTPSDNEGTPNVILEAMACGLPVIASRVGGIPDVVQHGRTGLLVNADDDAALQVAIERMILDRPLRLRLGERARAFVMTEHSVDRLPQRLQSLYESVLA
jgi:glycosyltransferase involved in cell wall biosynthesis